MYKIVRNLVAIPSTDYISHPSRLVHQDKSQLHVQEHIYFVIATQEFILPSYNIPLELSE